MPSTTRGYSTGPVSPKALNHDSRAQEPEIIFRLQPVQLQSGIPVLIVKAPPPQKKNKTQNTQYECGGSDTN